MKAITGLIGRENLVKKAIQEVTKGRHVLVTARAIVGKSCGNHAIQIWRSAE
jgi:hypothetical protein